MLGGERDSNTSSELFLSSESRQLRLPSFEDDNWSDQETELDKDISDISNNGTSNQNEWFDPKGNQPNIVPFTSTYGAKKTNAKVLNCSKVEDFYGLFVTDEIFEHISVQTNIYAVQSSMTHKHLHKWVPTDKNEIKRLFGLILWMGLVKLPSVHLYWSKDPLYALILPRKIMSKDRFEILLKMLHFSDNTVVDASDRLSTLQIVMDELNRNFKKYYDPPAALCIDESLIPYRGRIIFRQYMIQKRHTYGVKVFKLCCDYGYTYNFRVYTGQALDEENTIPSNIVMDLCKVVYHKGHTLFTDNLYTSVELANKLIKKNIHLIGTLRPTRKGNPNDVVIRKLKRGEVIAKENNNGITVLKWKDKKDILVLSTKNSIEMVNVKTKKGFCCKPKMVVDYNTTKTAINHSDRMTAYNSPLQRTLKWYSKLAFELLLNTAVVNALFMFQDVTGKKKSITTFRRDLVAALTQHSDREILTQAGRKYIYRLKKKKCIKSENTVLYIMKQL